MRKLLVLLVALSAGCADERAKCSGPADCKSGETCINAVCVPGSPSVRREGRPSATLEAAKPVVAAAPHPGLSEVVDLPRPAEGEYLGIYLGGKKIGYNYMKNGLVEGHPDQFESENETVIKAMVGNNVSERYVMDHRVYEAKPKGKLLSFTIIKAGDGGDETLEATSTAQGLRVLRKRPNQPNEIRSLPAARETVEDSDQFRVVLKRGTKMVGDYIDAQDLEMYRLTTTPDLKPAAERTIGGVTVKVRKVVTIFYHETVETNVYLDEQGRIIEIDFQGTMKAIAEPPDIAKKFETPDGGLVEVFSHTRIELTNEVSAPRDIPGRLTLVATGVPEKFRKDTYRQHYKALDKDRV